MFRGKFVVLSLIAAGLLCWQVMPTGVNVASSGIVDPCSSDAALVNTPPTDALGTFWNIVWCPQGDGQNLSNVPPSLPAGPHTGDATITLTVRDGTGAAIPGIPAADGWVLGCNDVLLLCAGAGSFNMDAATDASGQSTMSGTANAGGCENGLYVVVQGTILEGDPPTCDAICIPIWVRSPDTSKEGDANNPDGVVDSRDFTRFGNAYQPLGGVYDTCEDFDQDNDVESIDFTVFGNHWQHVCQ